jgi:argininosuccinate lyase
MKAASRTSYAIALDIAEQLVTQNKIPFREAHRIVGNLVDKAAAKGIALAELDSREIEAVLSTLKSRLDSKGVASIIRDMTPEKSIQLRRSVGSPRRSEQDAMIGSLTQKVKNYRQGIQKRINMVQGSFQNLAREVTKYRGS